MKIRGLAMRKRKAIGALLVVSALAAGCAVVDSLGLGGWRTAGCGACMVDITISPGATPCATANPDPLRVDRPGPMKFQIVTPGYHYSPSPGIAMKSNSGQFHDLPGQSNRTLAVLQNDHTALGQFPYSIEVDPDTGSGHCHVDPIVWNE